MKRYEQFYIDGKWVDPISSTAFELINPATEMAYATVSLGSAADVDRAVAAARRAFPSFSRSSKQERIALLQRIIEVYTARADEIMTALTEEMGAPRNLTPDFPNELRFLAPHSRICYKFQHVNAGLDTHSWNTQRVNRMTALSGSILTAA